MLFMKTFPYYSFFFEFYVFTINLVYGFAAYNLNTLRALKGWTQVAQDRVQLGDLVDLVMQLPLSD